MSSIPKVHAIVLPSRDGNTYSRVVLTSLDLETATAIIEDVIADIKKHYPMDWSFNDIKETLESEEGIFLPETTLGSFWD